MTVYSSNGEYNFSLDRTHEPEFGKISYPEQVIANEDGLYFVTDQTAHIKTYYADGRFKDEWKSDGSQQLKFDIELYGLAMDSEGNLLLGDRKNNRVIKHKQDGLYLGSIKVSRGPHRIAVTSQGTIVLADWGSAPQIVSNNTGQVIHTLSHPNLLGDPWDPWGVYCYEDIILIANRDPPNILCYSESGNYLGTILLPDIKHPRCIALTSDGRKLMVCDDSLVKIFSRNE